jgi:hypothetical protein
MGWIETAAKRNARVAWELAKAKAENKVLSQAIGKGLEMHVTESGAMSVKKPNGVRFLVPKEQYESLVARVARPMLEG